MKERYGGNKSEAIGKMVRGLRNGIDALCPSVKPRPAGRGHSPGRVHQTSEAAQVPGQCQGVAVSCRAKCVDKHDKAPESQTGRTEVRVPGNLVVRIAM